MRWGDKLKCTCTRQGRGTIVLSLTPESDEDGVMLSDLRALKDSGKAKLEFLPFMPGAVKPLYVGDTEMLNIIGSVLP